MYTVTKQYRAEIAHRLINYEGKCAHLHGHSYLFEATATALDLDDRGMIVDFKDLKHAMKEVLEPYDHACVLHIDDPMCTGLLSYGSSVYHALKATNGESGRLHLWAMNPTAEAMAKAFADEINTILAPTTWLTKFVVWETATSHATWTPEEAQ